MKSIKINDIRLPYNNKHFENTSMVLRWSYTSCGRLRSMLGRGDIMVWLVVEAGSEEGCTAAADKELPSTTYADWTARRPGSIATTTCATFPDVFSNAEECWLTTAHDWRHKQNIYQSSENWVRIFALLVNLE